METGYSIANIIPHSLQNKAFYPPEIKKSVKNLTLLQKYLLLTVVYSVNLPQRRNMYL